MIFISKLDYQRFNYVTAKVDVNPDDNIDEILADCRRQNVEFLIARCSTLALDQVQKMERMGFFLTDTLVYYSKKKISDKSIDLPKSFFVRAAREDDAIAIEEVAAASFNGYLGHYHSDRKLDRHKCDEVYSSWAANSCRGGDFCSHVILILTGIGQNIAAFATLKRHDETKFEGVLFGVNPKYQGKGLYNHLMDLSQQWGVENGLRQMLVSTQLTNITVQKAWCRHGFEPLKSCYTLHKWFI